MGWGDRLLAAELAERFASEVDEISVALQGRGSGSEVLHDLIIRGPAAETRDDPGYDFCLEVVCAALGKRLGQADSFDTSGESVAAERAGMAELHMELDLDQLLDSDLNLGLPEHAGPRRFGGVLAADMPELREPLERLAARARPSHNNDPILLRRAPAGYPLLPYAIESGTDPADFSY